MKLFVLTLLVAQVAAQQTTEEELVNLAYGDDVACPKGSSSYTGFHEEDSPCEQCFEGEYQNQEGQIQCEPCPQGESTPLMGYWECSKCPKGQITAYDGAVCESCPEGQYSPEEGGLQCLNCLAGSYQDEEGQAGCKLCPAGNYQDTPAKNSCDKCVPGKTAPEGATSAGQCTDCVKGSYAAEAGSACAQCPVLTYTDEVGATACKECLSNKDKTGATECKVSCKEGEVPADGDKCVKCPAGKFAPIGAEKCSDCPKGKFADLEGSGSCKPCPVKTYNPNTGSDVCLPCDGNDKEGMEICNIVCDAGEYVKDGKCVPCPTGTYEKAGQCLDCAAGTYADKAGSTICIACKAGSYNDAAGSDVCSPCPAATFQDKEGQTMCEECAPGTYGDIDGAIICQLCAAGFYNADSKATACKECTPGTITDQAGQVSCQACDAGTYSVSATECALCAAGTYSADDGATECVKCAAGTYADQEGHVDCTISPEGHYAPEGTVEPVPCPSGTFCGKGAAAPTPCVVSTYQPQTAQSACLDCPAGSYCNEEGTSAPAGLCPVGSYCPAKTAAPIACPAGKTTTAAGATSAAECVVTDCNPGYYKQDGVCHICPKGTFSNIVNAVACYDCPQNTYNSAEGSDHCMQCPDTAYTWGEGTTSFDDCIGPVVEVCSEADMKGNCHRYYDDSLQVNMTVRSIKAIRGEFDLYDQTTHRGKTEKIVDGQQMNIPEDLTKLGKLASISVILNNVFCSLDQGWKYHGRVRSVSESGKPCINWKRTIMANIAEPNHFCQNPLGVNLAPKPFCYVSPTETEPCDIPSCIWDMDCYTGVGIQYRGKKNRTHRGLECQNWNKDWPHPHGYHSPKYSWAGVGNHINCRNPDYEGKPWCYTTNLFFPIWDYCSIPKCTREDFDYYQF